MAPHMKSNTQNSSEDISQWNYHPIGSWSHFQKNTNQTDKKAYGMYITQVDKCDKLKYVYKLQEKSCFLNNKSINI